MDRLERLAAARAALDALDGRARVVPLTSDELAARERRFREAERRARRRAVVEGIPLTDADRDAIVGGALDDTFALRVVKKWLAATPTPALVLLGGVGTGKTVAGAYAAAELGGVYLSSTDLRPRLTRAAWDGDRAPTPLHAGFLLLDDLGAEKDKPDDFNPELYKLISARQGRKTRTVVTSNLTREQLAARYDARVIDRLNAMAHVIDVPGTSLRKKTGGLL